MKRTTKRTTPVRRPVVNAAAFRDDPLFPRIERVVAAILETDKVVTPIDVPCGMVVTCIGSRAEPIEGVPFNERWGIAENDEGRVKPGVYAVGWLKRGASGTIGTNRLDSYSVADLILADLDGEPKAGPDGLDAFVKDHNLRVTNYADWQTIKSLEEGAAPDPTPRQKYSTVEDMLAALDSA